MVGGEQWGELVDGPVGEDLWTAARSKRALTGQFASALERGEIWSEDGTRVLGRIPVAALAEVCNVGPQHRQVHGSLGVFNAYHGWNDQAQFHALWSSSKNIHQGIYTEPNAWLVPKPGIDHTSIWAQSGTLQITTDVRYNSQKIMAAITNVRALGVSSWHSLIAQEDDSLVRYRREIALALWCNCTLGLLMHVNHSNRSQSGRGRGNKAMLESLLTLDVRKLDTWQLEEAQEIWRDFRDLKFQSFHQCAVDPVRIELDKRVVTDLLGLSNDAVAAVDRLRTLLASDPSV